MKDDPYIILAEKAVSMVGKVATPGAYLVNSFPIRVSLFDLMQIDIEMDPTAVKHIPEWFPGAAFHKVAKEGRALSKATRFMPIDELKAKIVRMHLLKMC